MAATTVDGVRIALRRRYKTQLSMAVWRGYANLILDRVKYVGIGRLGPNKAQVWAEMREWANDGEFDGVWMAHETDVPLRNAFPNGWGDVGGDRCSRLGLESLESYILSHFQFYIISIFVTILL